MSRVYDVTLVANSHDKEHLRRQGLDVAVMYAPVLRSVSPFKDLACLCILIGLLRRGRFDVVHSVTPKAGLLASVSGAIARIPVRIHTFTGQVWVTRSGLTKFVLKTMDKLLARTATHVLVDSPSQRDFLVGAGVVSAKKSRVLANGSICGVDTFRFRPNPEARRRIRQQEAIPDDAVVFLFVGRIKVDKGVMDFAQAFVRLGTDYGKVWLLIVGPDEEGLRPHIQRICSSVADRLRLVGCVTAPQEYMAAADVLCLPSYREGFGSVIIEAAAVGIPAVASNIYGITDAIESGVTGLLHAAGDVADLQSKLKQMMDDQEFRTMMGTNARLRAHRDFSKELVTSALLDFYGSVVGVSPQGDVCRDSLT
ncbi:MAG: glycosyltransferase family 4 protein [Acidobacteriia bacterium]|nr:glycosyltransferase family 4 protein [Terriglobia bacterium]